MWSCQVLILLYSFTGVIFNSVCFILTRKGCFGDKILIAVKIIRNEEEVILILIIIMEEEAYSGTLRCRNFRPL